MKTPREVLLARHQAAEPKLDALREQVLATLNEPVREKSSWFERLADGSRHLLCVPRFAWSGLAAAWLVIIALNMASSDTPQVNVTVASAPTKRSPEMLQALREQKRFFAELVGSLSAPDAEAPRFVPRPRSDVEPQLIFA